MHDHHFFKIISDLKNYLPHLILVGGWVPYVYKEFIWKDVSVAPHYTTDIDFGIIKEKDNAPAKTIYEHLSRLKYKERHINLGKEFPTILLSENVPVEFICDKKANFREIQKITGRQINVNSLNHFDLVLSDIKSVPVNIKGVLLKIKIPSEPIFIFHKLVTFNLRENQQKMAKDLYYIYYMLRFSPNINSVIAQIKTFRKFSEWGLVKNALDDFFEDRYSKGVLLVESEFGPDSIISDLRKHIWETFTPIIKDKK